MRLLKKRFIGIPVIVILLMALVGTTAYAVVTRYVLDETIEADVTIKEKIVEISADLYTDALATIPFTRTHHFGTVVEGGTPQNPLWFRAAEIAPATVKAVADGLPTGASLSYVVGTPMGGQPGKPCPLALWLNSMPVGTYSFTITITGSSAPQVRHLLLPCAGLGGG